MRQLIQNTARDIIILMTDISDHITGKTGLTLAITASKNGGAFSTISPTVTERSDGLYTISLTDSHTDTIGDLVLYITATGADGTIILMQVVSAPASQSSVTDLQTDLSFLRRALTNKKRWDSVNSRWEIYNDAGDAVLYYLKVYTPSMGIVPLGANAIANGDKIA